MVDDLLVYRYHRENTCLWLMPQHGQAEVAEQTPPPSGDFGQHLHEDLRGGPQAPSAEAILKKVADFDPSTLKFFTFVDGVSVGGIPAIVSRTGYTGEDGFEIYVAWDKGAELWDALMEAGEEFGIMPVGLGARDSLRFEAGLPLFGHEFTDDLGPLEAGYGFFVKVDKAGGFIGQPVLKRQKEEGLARKIVGFRLEDKGVPRAGMEVTNNAGEVVGWVTSGGYCPSLDANMA